MSDSPLTLKDKACIVTGASQGIGRAIARRLCAAGASVLAVARTAARLDETVKACAGLAGTCTAHAADVTSAEQVAAMIARCNERFGRLDVLVNNAGVAPLSPIDQLSDQQFDELAAVNMRAVFLCTRAAWPLLRESAGAIVNISSAAADDPFPGFAAYSASKAWINALTRALANEGKPQSIRVFAVAPAAVETPLLRGLFPELPTEQVLDPDAVAIQVEWLLREGSRHLTGQILNVRP